MILCLAALAAASWLLAVASDSPSAPALPAGGEAVGDIEVVQSVPTGTALGLPRLREAAAVWREMIAGARAALDIGAFYYSDDPGQSDQLDLVLETVAAAARRGVRVRALADAGFARTYPEIPERIGALPGATARLLDARAAWGGVMHAKYFAVDGREFFLGSQNWDWRALEHISELGVRVRHAGLTAAVRRVFELDWRLALPAAAPGVPDTAPAAAPTASARLRTARGDLVTARLAASPPQALPPEVPWDQPLLVALIDGARADLRVQLLSYSPLERGGGYYDALDTALRRAAARGVQVRLCVANWSKRPGTLPHLLSLAAVPNLEVRFTNIPEAPGGFIPYARVAHAKFAVADAAACWLGTANWSGDYFTRSRNLSLFVDGDPGHGVARDLIDFFTQVWDGPYAEPATPGGEYAPPRIGE